MAKDAKYFGMLGRSGVKLLMMRQKNSNPLLGIKPSYDQNASLALS